MRHLYLHCCLLIQEYYTVHLWCYQLHTEVTKAYFTAPQPLKSNDFLETLTPLELSPQYYSTLRRNGKIGLLAWLNMLLMHSTKLGINIYVSLTYHMIKIFLRKADGGKRKTSICALHEQCQFVQVLCR